MDAFDAALAAHRAGDFATAERGYRQIMHVRNAAQNLGALYADHGQRDRAEIVFRWLLDHRPDYAPARHSLGMLLLAERRYEEGWPLHETGRRVTYPPKIAPEADFPEWLGEPLAGRRVVVCADEGSGDQIMFGRYLSDLRGRGADVAVACNPGTVSRLYEGIGIETVALTASQRRLPPADFWSLMGSLPAHLAPAAPPAPGYLARPPASGGGIGVVARGSAIHLNDANRSLPSAATARLLQLGRDLQPAATGARDFAETADIVAGLDLVITVDTAVAHLAGAMGKPLWVLLPRIAMDWRWNDGVRSDWYPTARLFRQPAPGDWDSVLDEVEAALRTA
jgi:hypothetical protein